jgi:hypothetical protein
MVEGNFWVFQIMLLCFTSNGNLRYTRGDLLSRFSSELSVRIPCQRFDLVTMLLDMV